MPIRFFDRLKITENFSELGGIEEYGVPKKGVLAVIEGQGGVIVAPL